MGKNQDLTDFKGGKIEHFADTSAFNAGVKEKNTKTNILVISWHSVLLLEVTV
jgi:hypothetical protein